MLCRLASQTVRWSTVQIVAAIQRRVRRAEPAHRQWSSEISGAAFEKGKGEREKDKGERISKKSGAFYLSFSLSPLLYSFERKKAVNEFDVQTRNAVLTAMLTADDRDNRNIILLAYHSHKFTNFHLKC